MNKQKQKNRKRNVSRARRNRKNKLGVKGPPPTKNKLGSKRKNRRSTFFAPVLGAAGSAIGGLTDIPGAGVVGGLLGRKAGDWIAKITGFGDYKVKRNSLMSSNIPAFGRSSTRIRHREFVTDVTSPGAAFNSRSYMIQPANSTLFPWLSSIAGNYSEYKFHGLIFQFKTTSGSAVGSTNTSLGTVVLATQYDVLHPPFSDKQSMEAHEFCVSACPDENVIHPIECDPSQSPLDVLYVQDSSVIETSDQRFHDFGQFQVATVGQQAAATIGELWVSYDIELLKPKRNDSSHGLVFHCDSMPTSDPGGQWFNDYKVHSGSSSLIDPISPNNLLRFYKSGRYLLYQSARGTFTASSLIDATTGTVGTFTPINFFDNHSTTKDGQCTNVVMRYAMVFDIAIDENFGYANMQMASATFSAITSADTLVIELPNTLEALPPTLDSKFRKAMIISGLLRERKLVTHVPTMLPDKKDIKVRKPITTASYSSLKKEMKQKIRCDSEESLPEHDLDIEEFIHLRKELKKRVSEKPPE